MSSIVKHLDHGAHADYRAAEGDHSHGSSFTDVSRACAEWLHKRGIKTGFMHYNDDARAARRGNKSQEAAR